MTLVTKITSYIDDGYGRSDKWVIEIRRVGKTYDIFIDRNGIPQQFKDNRPQEISVPVDGALKHKKK